jgi:hypothetical protein
MLILHNVCGMLLNLVQLLVSPIFYNCLYFKSSIVAQSIVEPWLIIKFKVFFTIHKTVIVNLVQFY